MGAIPKVSQLENNFHDGKLECPAKSLFIATIKKIINMGIEHYLSSQHVANLQIESIIVDRLHTILGYVSLMDKEHVCCHKDLFKTLVHGYLKICNLFEEIKRNILFSIRETSLDTVIEGNKRCLAIG
eukprot:GHVU01028268.1.p1 GENE.GHVU01028268.1~~GHVU01028268.1.p1  ORF type:complete len:128 (-),score=10.19 GHVU01028268.1:467-850(-)